MNNQDDAFKKGVTPWCRRRPIRSLDVGFPPVLDVRTSNQSHGKASKEEHGTRGCRRYQQKQGFLPDWR
jgi:hypothetical protein